MKTIYKKLLFVCLLFFLVIGIQYHGNIINIGTHISTKEATKDYIVKVKTQYKTLKVNLDDYLIGVLAGEMPVQFELEALKAQAVASRTFVLSRNLKVDNTTQSQVYLTKNQMKKNWGKNYQKYYQKIKKAITSTHNQVMTYQGQYISALFFSSSNGKTVNSEDYFDGGKVAYLKAVDSHWDLTVDPHNRRSQTFSRQKLASLLKVKISDLKITAYTESGYVKRVIVNDKSYTGRQIREKLKLPSSCFQIRLTSQGYTFITNGNGHGVGMSQYGAQGMAKENKDYQEILHHYYQNIKIQRI